MLGFLLLTISLILYFNTNYRYLSYFIYLSFMMGVGGGFGLWTDSILQAKNSDLAIIYTFIINVYLVLNNKLYIPNLLFRKFFNIFILFLALSVLFSVFYYQLSPILVLQGGRRFLLIASLPILIRIKPHEVEKLLQLLLIMVVFTSILYAMQIVIGRPIMPYGEYSIDSTVGLVRLYNSPANLTFFLTLSFVAPIFFKGNVNIYRSIFIVTLICTFGRTYIFTSIMTVLLALLLKGKLKKTVNACILIGIFLIPFIGTISKRFEKGNTDSDLKQIMKGDYGKDYQNQGDATMTYRLAWMYERAIYLLERPLAEQFFGMGLISDSQPIAQKKYRFKIGLTDESTGFPVQLSTPDIAYGNMLTYLGFGGMIIYLLFTISLTVFFFKNRKFNSLFLVCCAQMLTIYIAAFSGSNLSETKEYSLYFLILSLYVYKKKQKDNVPKEIIYKHLIKHS